MCPVAVIGAVPWTVLDLGTWEAPRCKRNCPSSHWLPITLRHDGLEGDPLPPLLGPLARNGPKKSPNLWPGLPELLLMRGPSWRRQVPQTLQKRGGGLSPLGWG